MNKSHLKKQQHLLKEDIERLKRVLASTAHNARGQAQNMLSESFENAKDKTTDMSENVKDYLHEKPFKALGIAVLSGWILGLALRRKRKSHHR